MAIKKTSPSLYKALGVFLPLITTNCAVLEVTIINIQEGYNFIETSGNAPKARHGKRQQRRAESTPDLVFC